MDKPIGNAALLLAQNDPWASWYEEALLKLGIPWSRFSAAEMGRLSPSTLLILAGSGEADEAEVGLAKAHLARGGSLLATGSTWGLEELLGLRGSAKPRYARSRINFLPGPGARLAPAGHSSYSFLGGRRAESDLASCLAVDPEGLPLAAQMGRAFYFGPHVGQTLGRLAMGTAVACDGIGPDDGSVCLDDGVPRCEDGIALDWTQDRQVVDQSGVPVFSVPHSDGIVEAFSRMVVSAMEAAGTEPVLAWPWPKGSEGAAIVSLDVDDGRPEVFQRALHALTKFGVRACWMTPPPGMPQDLARSLKRADQNIGLLFTGKGASFESDQVKAEAVFISRMMGQASLACARPQDGRWMGWERFYRFADAAGCRASLSKGGRQPGTTGFAFGTSFPFAGRGSDGSLLKVVEFPHCLFFPASPDGAAAVLASQAAAFGGCLHAGFALSSAADGRLDRSLQNLHMLIRQNRLALLSPEQAAAFCLGRRSVRIAVEPGGVAITSESSLPGFTLLCPVGHEPDGRTPAVCGPEVVRYGRRFQQVFVDLEPRSLARIGLLRSSRAA